MYLDQDRVKIEIDEYAIKYNLNSIKTNIRNNEIIAVVKSNAYGHGMVEISKLLVENGVTFLAVSNINEAITLRKNNIVVPILILHHIPYTYIRDAISYEFTQSVYSYEMARSLSLNAQKIGKKIKIHLKIDTGMGRVGFLTRKQDIRTIQKILQLPNLIIEGIYTHLSSSRKENIIKQQELFNKTCQEIEMEKKLFIYKHVLNSSGVANGYALEANYNAVRIGSLLYGLTPAYESLITEIDLKPVLSLKSIISFIKEVPSGTSIGYEQSYTTTKKTIVATIPCGFSDGVPRGLANKGKVLIKGEYAPIIGNICMNSFMVNISNIPESKIGDEVILLGSNQGNHVTVEEWASLENTINTDILCNLNNDIPIYNQTDYNLQDKHNLTLV